MKLNINNPPMKIKIDYHYSEKLNARRNLAMIRRKELKFNNIIEKGYVEYPANLMVKKTGESKYTLDKEF